MTKVWISREGSALTRLWRTLLDYTERLELVEAVDLTSTAAVVHFAAGQHTHSVAISWSTYTGAIIPEVWQAQLLDAKDRLRAKGAK